jgi:hypothetical protein
VWYAQLGSVSPSPVILSEQWLGGLMEYGSLLLLFRLEIAQGAAGSTLPPDKSGSPSTDGRHSKALRAGNPRNFWQPFPVALLLTLDF